MPSETRLNLINAIRRRPGMYIGELDPLRLVGELVANVLDLYLQGRADWMQITCHQEGWVTFRDNGPGLPFDELDPDTGLPQGEKHLVIGHDSPTADGHTPHMHVAVR